MGDKSGIAWTDATWNCLVGCTRVSAGCEHCYAERVVHRGMATQHRGLTKIVNGTPHWTGEVRLVESAMDLPLRWKRPRRIFVNSLSDLFHEKVPDEWLERIFRVMWRASNHTFQVLTKRPERMRDWLSRTDTDLYRELGFNGVIGLEWPLPNVHLGVSVEDQATADARIPLLLQTPAAVRWVSYEPALGPVEFDGDPYSGPGWLRGWHTEPEHWRGCDGSCSAGRCPEPVQVENEHRLDWLVVGGESGPGARPFDIAWARQTIAQCRAVGVPVFVKQLGAQPYDHARAGRLMSYLPEYKVDLADRKGADPQEWPSDLRVQEFPK